MVRASMMRALERVADTVATLSAHHILCSTRPRSPPKSCGSRMGHDKPAGLKPRTSPSGHDSGRHAGPPRWSGLVLSWAVAAIPLPARMSGPAHAAWPPIHRLLYAAAGRRSRRSPNQQPESRPALAARAGGCGSAGNRWHRSRESAWANGRGRRQARIRLLPARSRRQPLVPLPSADRHANVAACRAAYGARVVP